MCGCIGASGNQNISGPTSPKDGVIGVCEAPSLVAGERMQVLSKSVVCSYVLSCLSAPGEFE